MPTRKVVFAPDEYYHLYNRGMHKHVLFLDVRDWSRFLFLILHLQSDFVPKNISRPVSYFVQHRMFNINVGDVKKIADRRAVELIAFALMPNHFHLIIKEVKEGGISKYLQRILNAYTKYFNTKYTVSGHLFQGPFRATHISGNDQLLYASAYVHRNPQELTEWRNRDSAYPWSSFQDYSGENRWGDLLSQGIILEQFSDGADYKKWVTRSVAKGKYEVGDLI